MAILAFVTTAVELDTASRYSDRIARWVPEPFRVFAQFYVATDALEHNDPQAALEEARTLVRRNPLSSAGLYTLAMAQNGAGNGGEANEAVNAAAARGWRVPSVQSLMIDLTMRSGRPEQAAKHLAALWAGDTSDHQLGEETRRVLADPAGRGAFAKLLVTMPWRPAFLRSGPAMIEPEIMADTLETMAAAGGTIECNTMKTRLRLYRRQGHIDAADRIEALACS
ncbi:hypothetical protein B2G71_22175 [Novosphingobium sp. PC22D]|nr:hypothetical protein B2G71_22175 [Novosphingobium sp. PC22D]